MANYGAVPHQSRRRGWDRKSHVIMLISPVLEQMAKDTVLTKSLILRVAPIGVAAYGIGGRSKGLALVHSIPTASQRGTLVYGVQSSKSPSPTGRLPRHSLLCTSLSTRS
jgi:hypothetical protein